MLDKIDRQAGERRVTAARKLSASVVGLFKASGEHFETEAAGELALTFEGIADDLHAGLTRRAGSREPWYRRGTEMRNERQLTLVAPDELARVAAAMALPELKPEWIGANLLLDGLPDLSMLPPASLILFEGGATLKIDAQNAPCRLAGRNVARRAGMADALAGEMAFPKAAARLRGLTAWVEKPGTVRLGERAVVRVPEQWIY